MNNDGISFWRKLIIIFVLEFVEITINNEKESNLIEKKLIIFLSCYVFSLPLQQIIAILKVYI